MTFSKNISPIFNFTCFELFRFFLSFYFNTKQKMTESCANRELIVESHIPIEDNDYDMFVMFLESGKQSGGGDIEKIEALSAELADHLRLVGDVLDIEAERVGETF